MRNLGFAAKIGRQLQDVDKVSGAFLPQNDHICTLDGFKVLGSQNFNSRAQSPQVVEDFA
jgi:hypothetical protein